MECRLPTLPLRISPKVPSYAQYARALLLRNFTAEFALHPSRVRGGRNLVYDKLEQVLPSAHLYDVYPNVTHKDPASRVATKGD